MINLRRTMVILLVAAGALGTPARNVHAVEPGQPGAHESQQLWTCGMHPQVIRDKPGVCPICGMALTPVQVDADSGETKAGTLSIDPAIVQNMGVRSTAVVRGPLFSRVRAVGYIEEAEPNHFDINLRVSGWIEKLYANVEGMHVNAGDPLFDLYSPDLQVAIEELIAARKLNQTAAAPPVLLESARRKLRLLGLSAEQVVRFEAADRAPATVTFLSPMTAHVTEKSVYPGAGVKAGDRVLRLADRSVMWLDLQIFEQDLPFIRAGEKVSASVVAIPGRRFEGEISFTHPHLDPVTRTALARIILANDDGVLRQGMYASAEIRSQGKADALMVPREAVIDTGLRQLSFVSLGDGHFEPREVKLGSAAEAGQVEVLEGLREGEMVVVSGQFLLDAESRLREAQRKFLQTRSEGSHDQHSH